MNVIINTQKHSDYYFQILQVANDTDPFDRAYIYQIINTQSNVNNSNSVRIKLEAKNLLNSVDEAEEEAKQIIDTLIKYNLID